MFFGADSGIRTRDNGLGSRYVTITPYPRTLLLYSYLPNLARGF